MESPRAGRPTAPTEDRETAELTGVAMESLPAATQEDLRNDIAMANAVDQPP